MTAEILKLPKRTKLECSACGASANASCECGAPYVPAAQRVAEYDKANPGKSTRQAAADLGITSGTVTKARARASKEAPDIATMQKLGNGLKEWVTGRDGKSYPAKKKREVDPSEWTEEEIEAEFGPLETKEHKTQDDFIYLANIASHVNKLDLTGIPITPAMRKAAKAALDAWTKINQEINRG